MHSADELRVLVADDDALYRRGLVRAFDGTGDIEVVAEAATGEQAVAQAVAHAPDVVLMDVRMPGIGGIEATRRLIAEAPTARVLMLSASADTDDLLDAVKAGAAGYLLKETPVAEIGASAREVAHGHSFVSSELAGRLLEEFAALSRRASVDITDDPRPSLLTTGEVQVLQTMAQGAGNRAIADTTGLTEHAVRNHVRNILEKLQLATRTEAVMYAARARLIDP